MTDDIKTLINLNLDRIAYAVATADDCNLRYDVCEAIRIARADINKIIENSTDLNQKMQTTE